MSSPIARGGGLALAAACAFGVTAPLVKRYGVDLGPFGTAALLYAGAVVGAIVPLPLAPASGAPLTTRELPRVGLVALFGAFVAPACLAWGVQHTSVTVASLLLNLESVFTVVLMAAFYGEHVGGRTGPALGVMAVGGALLVFAQANEGGRTSVLGAVAVAIATLAWAADNALTRPLAELEPSRVVMAKGAMGAVLACVVARLSGEPMASPGAAFALVLCGAFGYGASLRLYLAAQRTLGGARTASIFAAAPFVGALVAVALGDRPPLLGTTVAAALCAFGVFLHLTEHHAHAHTHLAVSHEHAHRHDDGHHDHVHVPAFEGEHSHPHDHGAVTHEHEHAPDVHHAHEHEGPE